MRSRLDSLESTRTIPSGYEDLWRGEDLYRDLVENAHDPIYCIDLEGNFTCVNRAALRISGYRRDQVLGMNIADLVAPDHLERARQMIQQTLRGENPEAYDLEIVARDGRRVVLEVTHRLILKDGIPIGTHSIAREITERRHQEILEQDRIRMLEMMAGREPLADIFEHLVQMIERQFADVKGCLMLLRHGNLCVAAAPALPAEFVRAIDGVRASRFLGTSAVGGHLRRPVYRHDLATGDYSEIALKFNLQSCLSLPIATGSGKLLGTLDLYHGTTSKLNAKQLRFLESSLRSAALAIEHRQMTDALEHQAHHDSLTGLPNRTLFRRRLHTAIQTAASERQSVALLYIDLDQFKLVNDTLGHYCGDQMLRQVASRLSLSLKSDETLARISGDEFVIISPALADVGRGTALAESLMRELREPFVIKGQEIFVTASIGISHFPEDASDAETLLQCADGAMYRAKHAGKNRFARYEPAMGAAQAERLAVENHLHRALERDEFAVHYQPQFDLKTGRLAGYEALLRWTHPKLGAVSPARFVPIAEESGLITQIGAWALEQACRQARAWQRSGHPLRTMSVNVSAMQLEREDFVRTVECALLRSGLGPASLELEITESMLMRDIDELVRKLELLRGFGVRISVDDFGTGYSSLSYLQRLPIDILKLDRSFIEGCNHARHGSSLVRSVVNMAHGLGLRVTAEGIETHHQLEIVQDSGCDIAQGFLLGRPRPAHAAAGIYAFPMRVADHMLAKVEVAR